MVSQMSKWLVLLLTGILSSSSSAVLPLRDQWRAACQTMARGNATAACHLFEEFDQWYGDEPEIREASFREKHLRLWGLACMQAGLQQKGQDCLERWLDAHQPEARYHAFVRFQLASSYAFSGKLDEAVSNWQAFIAEHPNLPETALVHWKLADFHASQSMWKAAEPHLLSALDHPQLPSSGKVLVKAALALLELSRENNAAALEWLGSMEAGSQIGELWQAILAPSLVSSLLATDQPADAHRISSWFSRPERLESILSQLLQTGPSRPGLRQLVWNTHWRQQAGMLEANIRKSIADSELEASQYRLKLASLRRSGLARHSLVLARALLSSQLPVAESLRSTAYCEAIESCHVFKDWIQADLLVNEFINAFPDHPDIAEILYLQASSSAGRSDFGKALLRIGQLIDSYPEHRLIKKWKLSQAGWSLESGNAGEALRLYDQLESICHEGWHPFINFQQGRCEEYRKDQTAAIRVYQMAADHPASTPALQEQALLAILKLHLRILDTRSFEETLTRYRLSFPEGLNRIMVEILAATLLQQTARPAEAIKCLLPLIDQPTPSALQAYSLLSDIYISQSDNISLVTAAKDQLTHYLDKEISIPERPLQDLILAQQRMAKHVLDVPMLGRLMGILNGTGPNCPDFVLLQLLVDHWESYSRMLNLTETRAEDWLGSQASSHLNANRMRPYASYNLFLADSMAEQGRHDSADARRIHVLQSVKPQGVGEHASSILALTAASYSFPESRSLLELFLRRFPVSNSRPEILLNLATLLRSGNADTVSRKQLEEIRDEWPDSTTFPEASILLAEWLADDGLPEAALATLDKLLDRGDLGARMTARAILLRAELFFSSGKAAKGIINCQRLLQLYPAFHDIADAARELLNEHDHAQTA